MMLLVSELLQYTFVTGRFYGCADPEARHVKVELLSRGLGRLTNSAEPRRKEYIARLSLGKREFLHGQANAKPYAFTVSPFLPSRSTEVVPTALVGTL